MQNNTGEEDPIEHLEAFHLHACGNVSSLTPTFFVEFCIASSKSNKPFRGAYLHYFAEWIVSIA